MRKYKEYFQTLSVEALQREGYGAMYRTFLSFRLWGHNPNRYSESHAKTILNNMATLANFLHNVPGCLQSLEEKKQEENQDHYEVIISMLVYELSVLYDHIEQVQKQKWFLNLHDSNMRCMYEEMKEKMKKE